MNRLSKLAHWLWIEVRLGAPPFVQHTVVSFLHRAKEGLRLLFRPYMPLYELKGHNQAGPLTVTYGGLGYFKPLLKNLLFTEQPVEREIARMAVWHPGNLHLLTSSDLTVVESGKYLIGRLPTQSAIVLPFRVQFVLDLQGEWEEVEQRFHRHLRRQVRSAGRYEGYQFEVSRREQDLKVFYHEMYLPTMRKRHGELAALLPERQAYQVLRHGQVFLVKRDGVYVCGSIGIARQGVMEGKELGVLGGDEQLMKAEVLDAMMYLIARWAHQAGLKAFSFGDSWPYLSGGFQNKRKWGTIVSIPPYEHKRIWIGIQRNTPAVVQFLSSNPCMILDGNGGLQALVVTDDVGKVVPETEATWRRQYTTPGLSDVLISSVTDLMKRPLLRNP